MFFCTKSYFRTKGEVAGLKSALDPPVVYHTDRFKAVVPLLVLLFVAFVLK